MLSHAARLELIRSVFSAIPVYYMSNILFSKKFIAKLTAVIRNFWWTGIRETDSRKSLCLRAWKDISNSKTEGGLGIRNLKAINESLILAAAWREVHPNRIHIMAANTDCALQAEAQVSGQVYNSFSDSLNNEQHIPLQGTTIKSDIIIKGTKIYSDAAFRSSKIPGIMRGQVGTGIGIYFSIPIDHGELNIQIQASAPVTTDPTHAEAKALSCAALIANKLNVQQPTFFTDCLPLASAAASKTISHPATPWNIRNELASFNGIYSILNAQVFHISRNLNGVAHNLAQQVYQASDQPLMICSTRSHDTNLCPVAAALAQFSGTGFQLHKVYCY
ncbi:hypothetical protein ACQJBY_038180 [Aegilops geniculata]